MNFQLILIYLKMGLKMLEKFHVSQKDIVYINEEKLRSVTKQILMTQEIPEKDAYMLRKPK